jgi:hypothetical protein
MVPADQKVLDGASAENRHLEHARRALRCNVLKAPCERELPEAEQNVGNEPAVSLVLPVRILKRFRCRVKARWPTTPSDFRRRP